MSQWRSLHVYYYDRDQDALLLDAVRTLFEELSDRVERCYVVRHWRLGPHLRLNVRTDLATWQGLVLPRADALVGRYLREHPSTASPDRRAALARHRMLALQEQEQGPLEPWVPDNSIRQAPYDHRRHVLGAAAAELLADFYHDTTPMLFEMLEAVRSGGLSRDRIAMTLMLTVAHTSPGPLERGYVAFRSHAEGFLAVNAEVGAGSGADAYRRAFDQEYAERRRELTVLVREVVDTVDATGDTPFARRWAGILLAYGRRAAPLVDSGELAPPTPQPAQPVHRHSGLHRLMFGSDAYQENVFSSAGFRRYRVLLNYTYLQLTRFGVTPLDRFRACYLVAGACEEVFGTSAVDLVERYVLAHP